jgi:glycosyltransferase involved in cell wall biosynthesis
LVILPYEGPLYGELEKAGVRVMIQRDLTVVTRQKFRSFKRFASMAFSLPLSAAHLWRTVRAFRPDLIHTNTALILTPGIVARLCRLPHVWHVREFFAEFPSFWRHYQRFMLRFSDVILCVSAAVARQFDTRIQEKVVVIHNGLPQGEFAPLHAERVQAFREAYGLNGCRVVGVVGRIKFGRKGQDTFIRAAALLKQRFPDVKFACIGTPFPGNEDHLERLQQLVVDLKLENHVLFTGDVEDIQVAYASLEVSVLPTGLPEPFGGVVIESMAMGKPVVGTRLGGTIEQIEDGVTGFLVEPNNPQELASAIERLLTDKELRMQFGENGRKRYLTLFEFERFYQKMLAVYAKLLRGRSNA